MKEIKEVKIKKNIIEYNKHHERGYLSKTGVMIIEYTNGEKSILDLESNTDISKSDYLSINDTSKTRENVLFKNIMYDTKKLKKLANGSK